MNDVIKAAPPAKKVDAGRGNTIKSSNNDENHFVILYLDEHNVTRATTFNTYDAKQAHDYIKLLNPQFNIIMLTNGKIHQE